MKTIQIPIDEKLLEEITEESRQSFANRSDFIRHACKYFIRYLRENQKDDLYAKGYKKLPEEVDMATIQTQLATSFVKKEEW